MLHRLLFSAIVLFWMVMNVLLWRAEFRGRNELGSAIPINVVWNKVLTAPDDSGLEITRHGEKVGYCRWRANVGETLRTGKVSTENHALDGQVERLSGYTLDLEGNMLLAQLGGRIRFDLHGDFTPEHRWKEFTARVSRRPQAWQVRAMAGDESVTIAAEDGDETWQRRITLAELRDPGKLLRELGSPWAFALLNQLAWPREQPRFSLGLHWQARNDWLQIGHSKVRVYRLQAKLLDRYQAVVIVSRVGEILRVELPDELVFMNDALVNL